MNKKKEKVAALVAILVVFVLLCMSCAVPIPLMLPVVESHSCPEIPGEPVLI